MSTHPPNTSREATPAQPVRLRDGATIDHGMVHLVAGTARKRNAFPGNFGYPIGARDLQSRLRVEAWVSNTTFVKSVWLDAHVFDRDGALLRSETLPLQHARAADNGGDIFLLDVVMFQGSSTTDGAIDSRPDARAVQYRLYCEQSGGVFTDGLAHWSALRMDSTSS